MNCHLNKFRNEIDDIFDYSNIELSSANCLLNSLSRKVTLRIVNCHTNNQLQQIHYNMHELLTQMEEGYNNGNLIIKLYIIIKLKLMQYY